MSTEAPQTIQPAVDPVVAAPEATTAPTTTASTETPASIPAAGISSDKATDLPTTDTAAKDEVVLAKDEVLIDSHPINEGILNLKSPGLK